MVLAIIWTELGNGEKMNLTLLTALAEKSNSSFPWSYTLSSRHWVYFNAPTSKKHCKDCWFFFDGRWLASDGPIVAACLAVSVRRVSVLSSHDYFSYSLVVALKSLFLVL